MPIFKDLEKYINFYFKNNWVIAIIWKFQLWISLPYICWKLRESDPKSEFSNGYNSVIFKVKIYEKISRHWELQWQFKNARIFEKQSWEDFFLNSWKSAIFRNIFFQLLKIAYFQIFFKKSSHLKKTFLISRGNSQCLLIFS